LEGTSHNLEILEENGNPRPDEEQFIFIYQKRMPYSGSASV
jgi:hypothetical protein